MSESEWGLCKDCKWWQIEPKASIENTTVGQCIEEQLQPFVLRVSGNSGCNVFSPGKPARAEGSSCAPPEAAPTR
jgi:hypothetical protein